MQVAVVRIQNPQISLLPLEQANQQLLPQTQQSRGRSITHSTNKQKLPPFNIATLFRTLIYLIPKGQAQEQIL
jgi:hypothetical protein